VHGQEQYRLSGDPSRPCGDNQVIVFDLVYTNLGNDYNHQTGIFTCSVQGLYAFYVHTLAEPGKHLETEITKSGGLPCEMSRDRISSRALHFSEVKHALLLYFSICFPL
jgi:hypothetical protein